MPHHAATLKVTAGPGDHGRGAVRARHARARMGAVRQGPKGSRPCDAGRLQACSAGGRDDGQVRESDRSLQTAGYIGVV